MDYFSKNKATFWIIVLLAALNVLTLGSMWMMFAKKRPHPHHHPPDREMPGRPEKPPPPPDGKLLNRFLNKELELSEEQSMKFDILRQQHREKVQQVRDEMRRLHREFDEAHTSGQPDRQKLEQKADEMSRKERELKQLNIDHFFDMRQLLQPEQQQRFDQLFEEMQERRGNFGNENE